MEFGNFYVRKGVLYIQRHYLRVGEEIYAAHDEIAAYWRIVTADLMIANQEEFVCEHCGRRFSATEPFEAHMWIYYELCEECYEEGELYGNDEPCIVEKMFLRKGGKIPKDDVSIDDLYNITLN